MLHRIDEFRRTWKMEKNNVDMEKHQSTYQDSEMFFQKVGFPSFKLFFYFPIQKYQLTTTILFDTYPKP